MPRNTPDQPASFGGPLLVLVPEQPNRDSASYNALGGQRAFLAPSQPSAAGHSQAHDEHVT